MTVADPPVGQREKRLLGIGLVLILTAYLGLALPLIDRQGIQWDEQTDLDIASAYTGSLRALLLGSDIDVINVRLPTYSVAFLDRLGFELGLRNARLVSCAVGALVIIATALFGSAALDSRKGLLAAAILATSPYFLAFSPLAFTEGDVFLAGCVVWSILAGERFRRAATWSRGCALGLTLGLALSAKISAAAVVAAVVLVILVPSAWRALPTRGDERLRQGLPWLGLGLAFGGWVLLQAIATGAILPGWHAFLPGAVLRPLTRFAIVAAFWGALIAWALRNRAVALPATARLSFPLLLAMATFFVIPPVHTGNSAIFAGLWRASLEAGREFDPAFAVEAAALHFAVTLLKPGVVVGGALWLSTARAGLLLSRRPELRLPAAVFVFYAGFLLTLPWAQVRYMMPLFPLMALFGADAFVDLMRKRRRVAVALAIAAIGSVAWDFRLCYPDLNLNGYQWVGARNWAGRSTLGYRGIAQLGSDGVEQVLRWTAANAEPGASVASYLPPRHITHAILTDTPFHLIDGLENRAALEQADYVLTSLNGEIRSGNEDDNPTGEVFQFPLYDRTILVRDFEQVFAVRRAFEIEIASVWKRR